MPASVRVQPVGRCGIILRIFERVGYQAVAGARLVKRLLHQGFPEKAAEIVETGGNRAAHDEGIEAVVSTKGGLVQRASLWSIRIDVVVALEGCGLGIRVDQRAGNSPFALRLCGRGQENGKSSKCSVPEGHRSRSSHSVTPMIVILQSSPFMAERNCRTETKKPTKRPALSMFCECPLTGGAAAGPGPDRHWLPPPGRWCRSREPSSAQERCRVPGRQPELAQALQRGLLRQREPHLRQEPVLRWELLVLLVQLLRQALPLQPELHLRLEQLRRLEQHHQQAQPRRRGLLHLQ